MFSPAVVSCSHGSLSLMLNRYDLLDVILAVIYESSMIFSEIDINQVMVMVIGHRRGYASWFWEVLRARGWNVVSDVFFILCNKGKAREAVLITFFVLHNKDETALASKIMFRPHFQKNTNGAVPAGLGSGT